MTDYDRLLAAAYKTERASARRLALRDDLTPEQALRITLELSAQPSTLATLLGERARDAEAACTRAADREQRKLAALAHKQARHEGAPSPWRAWFDGSAHPNPGRCGIGAVLKGPHGEIDEIVRAVGFGNSSEAEYQALIAVLEAALARGARGLTVYGDSRVVIDDVNGPAAKGAASLQGFRQAARDLIGQLDGVTLRWIPRAKNAEADALSQRAVSA
jgi:ribonuclease HI